MDGAVAYALLPARIDSKELSALQADKDGYTFWVKAVKALLQAFLDHLFRPQTTPHCPFIRSRGALEDEINRLLDVDRLSSTSYGTSRAVEQDPLRCDARK